MYNLEMLTPYSKSDKNIKLRNLDKCSKIFHQLAEVLGTALDARDRHTYLHSVQVADISSILSNYLHFDSQEKEILHIAAHLHDIGKIAIPDSILQKTEKLNAEEWQLIKQHPVVGCKIISALKECLGSVIEEVVLLHHERVDGHGYPYGLKGTDIPPSVRVVSLADAVSAMFQDRPYRRGLGFEEIKREILLNKGKQFCPVAVDAFLKAEKAIRFYLGRFKKYSFLEKK